MAIRKRVSKKVKNGYVYEVNFTYKINGISYWYWEDGFKIKKRSIRAWDSETYGVCQ